jgi:hypothetical protein
MPFSTAKILNEKEEENAAKYVLIEQVREHSEGRRGSGVGSDEKTNRSFYTCLTRVTAWILKKGARMGVLGCSQADCNQESV